MTKVCPEWLDPPFSPFKKIDAATVWLRQVRKIFYSLTFSHTLKLSSEHFTFLSCGPQGDERPLMRIQINKWFVSYNLILFYFYSASELARTPGKTVALNTTPIEPSTPTRAGRSENATHNIKTNRLC